MISEVEFLDYTNGLLEGDKQRCVKIVNRLKEKGVSIIDIYVHLFQRALYRIGKLWEDNKITVADEHIGTEITEGILASFYPNIIPQKKVDKTAVITCVDKEFHKIGARMASDVFELNGWNVVFLGASTPTKEVLKTVKVKNADVVGLSFNFYLNVARLHKVIEDLKSLNPDINILVGGQGLSYEKENLIKKYPDVKYFSDVYQLDSFLKNYN